MDSFLGNLSQGQGYSSIQTGMGQNVTTSYTTQQVSTESILELQPGDTFQGEIISVNGQEVHLQLANEQYMVARLEGEVQLALGQLLNFQVQSNQNSKIVLKPIYANLLQQRVGEAALKAANLAVNDKSLQMVSKLMEQGVSIDKNTLALFNRQLLQHPQVNVESLIRLQRLGVKITDANLVQLEHYQNMEHKLLDGIEEVVDDIGRLYDSIADNNGVMSSVTNSGKGNVLNAVNFMEQMLKAVSEGENTINEQERGSIQRVVDAGETEQNAKSVEVQTDVVRNLGGSTEPEHMIGIEKQFQGLSDEQITEKLHSLMKQEKLDVNTWKELLFSEHGIGAKISIEEKNKLFRTETFRELLKDTLQNEWSLKPEELTEDGKLKEFYQKLIQQNEKLTQIMEQAAAQNQTNSGNALQNIRENVEFINQINQMFQYVQLPLKMSGSQAQGELYVYTNKRNLAKKDGLLTAILHLDMENLGNMDINISLNMDTEQVTTRFYLDEESVAFLQEHIGELAERLAKKGYQCKHFVEKRTAQKSVFQEIEEQAGGMSAPLVYQKFDIRT